MKELTVTELWNKLVEGDFFTERELQIITDICGNSVETLNSAVFARYGYLDLTSADGEWRIEMKELTITELWDALVEGALFTEEELKLLTNINGYNIATLNDAIYSRYGYRDYEQMISE